MRTRTFADSFWGADFSSTLGYDVLLQRMKDGRQMCKDAENFLSERAKIEESYSTALQKLAKNAASGSSEIGTLRQAWDCLKNQTLLIANSHQELRNNLNDRVKDIKTFREGQRQGSRLDEENVKKSLKKKTELFKKTSDCQKSYENKCKELETAMMQLSVARSAGTAGTDRQAFHANFKTLQVKEQKASSEKERADNNYKDSVKMLDQARQTWENDMDQLCKNFEKLEIERFNFLQNDMWVHTNQVSLVCVSVDQYCETVRLSIGYCDVDADISKFIDTKGTGTKKPEPVKYRGEDGSHPTRHTPDAAYNHHHGSSLPPAPSNYSNRPPPTRPLPQPR